MYPISILGVAFVVTAVIMIWVVPAFKTVFTQLWRRSAGTNPVRDGHFRLLR